MTDQDVYEFVVQTIARTTGLPLDYVRAFNSSFPGFKDKAMLHPHAVIEIFTNDEPPTPELLNRLRS